MKNNNKVLAACGFKKLTQSLLFSHSTITEVISLSPRPNVSNA